jgi:NAD+ diphosphatase
MRAGIRWRKRRSMPQVRSNFLAGPYLERRAEAREDPDWEAAARADPATRYLLARGTTQLLRTTSPPAIAFLGGDAPPVRAATSRELVLLGWFRGARCVLVELTGAAKFSPPEGTRFEELRPLTAVLPAEEAGLLAYARALSIWRARTRHCGVCGTPTQPERAGHSLCCPNPECGEEFFPRLDPAIIVLVTDGERALLGRQASWPARRYSTIAGFVEPGESLEDAVAREVAEETGVEVQSVSYDSSQPWPFPCSLMLGFRATAHPASRVQLGGELEDAAWFTREQLRSGEVLTPPSQAISWRLISAWLEGAG